MASFWERVVSAWTAAVKAYREPYLIPDERYDWDERAARIFRYHFYSAYYNNIAYRDISHFAATYKRSHALYKHVRGIYNPVARLVDLYVSRVYGGALDMETLEGGAVPIAQADDTLRDAIRQLWQWSNWSSAKSLYVRHGAMLGDVGLWVFDDRAREQVRLEVVHPGKIKLCEFDEVGSVERVIFEYNIERPDVYEGREFTFSMEVTNDEFVTYANGAEYPLYDDGSGNMISRWPNEYGFVPFVLAKHKDLGMQWGGSVFHTSINKIDELNDAASLVNDSIRKNVNQIWFMAGVRSTSDISIGGTTGDRTASSDASAQRDQLPMVFASSPDAKPISMAPTVDVASALANIEALLLELERDMPELSLHRIRASGDLTAPGVRAGYSDAIDRIVEARGNYDSALVRAQKMAIMIGGQRAYANMQNYNILSDEQGDLDHYIPERAVIEDGLTKQERLNVLLTLPERPEQVRLVLQELEYDAQRIDEIIANLGSAPQSDPFGVTPGDEPVDDNEADFTDIDNLLSEIGVEPAA